jgi:hypothetical protein
MCPASKENEYCRYFGRRIQAQTKDDEVWFV